MKYTKLYPSHPISVSLWDLELSVIEESMKLVPTTAQVRPLRDVWTEISSEAALNARFARDPINPMEVLNDGFRSTSDHPQSREAIGCWLQEPCKRASGRAWSAAADDQQRRTLKPDFELRDKNKRSVCFMEFKQP